MKVVRLMACAVTVLVIAASAQATLVAPLLNLTVTHPQFVATDLTVTYDANGFGANGKLQADAFLSGWSESGGPNVDLLPWGALSVVIEIVPATGAGVFGLGGHSTLLVTGDVNPDDGSLETLFTSSTLFAFGSGTEDKFEAIFVEGPGGTQAPVGAHVGVIIWGQDLPQFHEPFFTADFGPGGTKADVFSQGVGQVPEPGTLLLVGTGLLGTLGYIRRRRMTA